MPGPAFVQAAQRCGGAQFFHRYSCNAQWEPYTEDQNSMMLRAMIASPESGAMPLQLGPAQFEIRWGRGGEFGIQQVNLRSHNTRDVQAQVRGVPHSAPGLARKPSFIESGFSSRSEYETALAEGFAGAVDISEGLEGGGMTVVHAHWWWQEDAEAIGKHNPSDVKQPGNWVRYAGSVCAELDDKWHAWVRAGKSASLQAVPIDLENRIGSTGTEGTHRLPSPSIAFHRLASSCSLLSPLTSHLSPPPLTYRIGSTATEAKAANQHTGCKFKVCRPSGSHAHAILAWSSLGLTCTSHPRLVLAWSHLRRLPYTCVFTCRSTSST